MPGKKASWSLIVIAALAIALATPGGAAGWSAAPASGQEGHERGYDVRKDRSNMVPMRDGALLSTDIYFPDGAEGPLSTILIRTPYNKENTYPYRRTRSADDPGWIPTFVSEGYVVVVQDIRGRFESEGRYRVRYSDRDDGYDTVEWLINQPWSDQKVATFGCSYLGETQLALSAAKHPNHIAAMPQAPSAAYYAPGRPWSSFDGGVFELAQTAGWFLNSGTTVFMQPPDHVDREEWFKGDMARKFMVYPDAGRENAFQAYQHLPIVDIVKNRRMTHTDYEEYASNPPESDYFYDNDFVRSNDTFDVPALYIDSWYDFGVDDTLTMFNQMRDKAVSERARRNQFVIVAPSTHCGWERATENTIVGERELGDARKDFQDIYMRWMAHWLKGDDNGITDMPRVQYYLMGANEWRSDDYWPPSGTTSEKIYLQSGGRANSRFGDGTLSWSVPSGDQPADRFTYDPATPVPTRGGNTCCTGFPEGSGGYDQSTNEMRADILVYTSEPLEEGIEVTGDLGAVLYVGSDAKDTDFTLKLVDVYPDGRAFNIQEGARRMRYRDNLSVPVWMEAGEVYEIQLDLHAASNYFAKGHRIRVEVSSSNFPRWSRNLNTGGNNYDETEWVVANQIVHHSAEYPSHVILPIVKSGTVADDE